MCSHISDEAQEKKKKEKKEYFILWLRRKQISNLIQKLEIGSALFTLSSSVAPSRCPN